MAYAIQYRESAKRVLETCRETYGPGSIKPVEEWLKSLALEAEEGTGKLSIDAGALFEAIANTPNPSAWKMAWLRWLDASLVTKIEAVAATVSKRRPPWEFRAAAETLLFLDVFAWEATVFDEIDQVKRRIIVTLLDLPPGLSGP